ncbi:response regulator transcription factor [Methylocystis parvus]|uniref:response regulator transcription factor n=1 Tax=Methylocystis parvus TaxID=134 RepID=UPI003C71F1CB
MTRILLVEDDAAILRDIRTVLEANGYLVETTADGEEAWFKGDAEDYAAVVLDLGLPRLDGLAVLKRWRQNGRTMPVIVLTARGTWPERVEGIDAGADDYLGKPFRMEELLARLRSVLRRHAGQATSLIECGSVMLDERQMRVSVKGAPLALSALEYRLVSFLIRNRGRVVPQHELMEHVYAHNAEPDSNALEVLIGRVRRKLGVDLIETRRGFGYIVPGPT